MWGSVIDNYTGQNTGIAEQNKVDEGQNVVRNADGRCYWGETSVTGENRAPFEMAPTPREAGADTTHRTVGAATPRVGVNNTHAIFSLKALATSVLSVGAVATVTVAAIMLSVVLNVVLLVATTTSLSFQLDINYSPDDALVAVLSAPDFERAIALDGDTCITFDNLQPDTLYTLRIINAEGDTVYEKTYTTLAEDVYHCSLWGEFEQDTLMLGVYFYDGETPDYYTVGITDKGGKTLFGADYTIDPQQPDSEPIFVEGLSVDGPVYVTVRVGNRGVAALTIYPQPHDIVQQLDVNVTQTDLVVRYYVEDNIVPIATINGAPVTLQSEGEGRYLLHAVDLQPSTEYTVLLTDGNNQEIWYAVYTTAALPLAKVTQLDVEIGSTSLRVFYGIDMQGQYFAMVGQQQVWLESDGEDYLLMVEELQPDTDYSVTIFDQQNNPLFNAAYTTLESQAEPFVLVEQEIGENYIILQLKAPQQGVYHAFLDETECSFDLVDEEDTIYVLSATDLSPAITYEISVVDENKDIVFHLHLATQAEAAVTFQLQSQEVGETYIGLQLLADKQGDYHAFVNEEECAFGLIEEEGLLYGLSATDLSPATFYEVRILDQNDVEVYTNEFTTLSIQQQNQLEFQLVSQEITEFSILLQLQASDVGNFTAYVNDEEVALQQMDTGDNNYELYASDLQPATPYVVRILDQENEVYNAEFTTQPTTPTAGSFSLLQQDIGDNYITLQLQADGEGSYYAYVGGNDADLISMGDLVYQLSVADLEPDTTYTVLITDVQENELYSAEVTTLSAQVVQDGWFELLSQDIGETYINLQWQADSEGDYYAYINEDEVGLELMGDFIYMMSATDLQPATTYAVRVTDGETDVFVGDFVTKEDTSGNNGG